MLLLLALAACTSSPPDTDEPADTDVDTDTDTDTDDTGTPPLNQPPTAAEIVISPSAPAAGTEFGVVLVTPSTDPDGDAVTYGYAWTVDGVAVALDGPTVPVGSARSPEVWGVTVTPTDGTDAGPSATASVTIGNSPPSAPGLSFNPAEPLEGESIELVFDPPPIDPDGDPLTVSITWYDDESFDARLTDLMLIDGRYVSNNETFRAVVSVTDGFNEPVVTEASVRVSYRCDAPPDAALEQTTFSEATAYHGIGFDDDGTLIGWDTRSSLLKSTYDGGSSVFLPGVSGIQQIDRLPDGDFVVADSSYNRLLRVTSAGGSETLASDVGYAYGVTVGPDGDVWVSNGGILRVDVETGATTTVLASGSISAHVVNFNLDSTVLYIGTIGSGVVYSMNLDENLNAITEPTVFATGVGSGWHDGLELDECGNLYVADYSTGGFYRVTKEAVVSAVVPADRTAYGHGTTWGHGVGGWRDDAIYQPQPYNNNTVREVVIGFRSGDTVRTWNGVPAPW
jgi:sugar lactone lactonase YvrE